MSDVYREYLKYSCQKNPAIKPLCRYTFDCTLKERNIAFQTPKKDKCDTCGSYESKNLYTQIYEEHIRRKEQARDEKNRDKLLGAKKEAIVLAQDMQAVKVCPYLNASALYYKTKLVSHNFTVFDINTHHCVCYWFNETEADLTANTFASYIVDYILQLEDLSKPVIIWSDGCTYQNKNVVLSNALFSLSVHKNTTIYQKYLERGHTQMEVDSVHAAIERNLKNKSIYLPSDYFKVTMDPRKKGLYSVKNIHFDFAKDYSILPKFDSIRPGRRVNDPTVNDIKVIKYTPDGNIQVELDFNDDFQDLPQRRVEKPVPDLQSFPQLRKAPIKIKKQKWEHLQQLKAVISQDCHSFYDNLSHLD
ncbi:unnamed protein product [Psylliodes chrysocephalus]|uniref:Uncharacterized protein n=1 Tax=Psylliodes chrysocephalus TaxID=3402493 RepID=A0A9P0CI93_9CUCU|nr:unnamed protein product [Psylliodes chrysocephala]